MNLYSLTLGLRTEPPPFALTLGLDLMPAFGVGKFKPTARLADVNLKDQRSCSNPIPMELW